MKPIKYIYLHGFASSSHSKKAQQFIAAFTNVVAPDLPTSVDDSLALIEYLISTYSNEPIVLIGSSLGGYYARYFAHAYSLPCVLINPSLEPYITLASYVKRSVARFSGKKEMVQFTPKDIEHLKQMQGNYPATNTLLLLQSEDETLDFNVALRYMPDAMRLIRTGGNHAYENFQKEFDLIRWFCNHYYA